jgi:hypothetical protein
MSPTPSPLPRTGTGPPSCSTHRSTSSPNTPPPAGRLEHRDADSCLFHAGGDSLGTIALYVALKGIDFQILHPPELKDHIRTLAIRLAHASRDD